MRQKRRPGPRQSLGAGVARLLVLGLLATACQPARQLLDPLAQSTPVGVADTVEASSPAPGTAPTLQVAPTQPAAPTIRTELAATDPATVNLASGKPSLVEFFAFW